MLTKSTLSGRRARRLAASMTVVFGAQFAGCVDQPTEPAREVVTAARPNADVVYTAPWYPSEFYEILDENGAKIWQTEADLPLQGGYFTLAYALNVPSLSACALIFDGVYLVSCPHDIVRSKLLLEHQVLGDPCQLRNALYPFAHVLTTVTCYDLSQVFPGFIFDSGDRIQLVAAPTAPGGRVFKRWRITLQNIASDPYPCDEGQASLTCTLTANQDYTTPTNFSELKVIYGPPDDVTPPTITITTPPANASYTLGQSVLADFTCVDEAGGSGIASCIGPAAVNTATAGPNTFKVDAVDNSANASTLSRNYSVSFAFSGFAEPVSGDIMNVAKAGKTIPLKWRLLDANGNPITTLTSVSVTVASLVCSAGTTTDAVEEYSTGSSGLQNLGDGYYQYNWKTPASYANSCKTLHLDLGEGITRTAAFQFTK